MKKLLFIALVALSSIGAFAQSRTGSTTIQPKIGLNVSTVGDLDWKAGFVFGAEIQHQFTSKMGLAGGLLYSFQGGKHDDYSWNPGYLNIPVTLNYYVAKNFALKAGLQPGFKVSSKVTAKAGGFSVTENLDDAFKSFDLSVPVGISYEYMNVCLDARYNIGVTKVMDGTDSKNSVFQVTLGYKFAL